MARLPKQNMTPGIPAKPPGLPKPVAAEWDRLIADLTDSNITIAKAHGRLIAQAAQIAVDISEAMATVKDKGAYYKNPNTGAILLHPAARRLDGLRRDYVKVLSLLGLRSAFANVAAGGDSLEDKLDEGL